MMIDPLEFRGKVPERNMMERESNCLRVEVAQDM